jgi:hypothetical protein
MRYQFVIEILCRLLSGPVFGAGISYLGVEPGYKQVRDCNSSGLLIQGKVLHNPHD